MSSNKYKMYFNYDNDKKKNCIPVLPEKIKVTVKGQVQSVDIDKLGEILFKGKRGARTVSFSSFFPPQYIPGLCSCSRKEFKSPLAWNKSMHSLMSASKPCHFVLTGSPMNINFYGDIISFVLTEEGGDVGALYYTVEVKEHRSPTVRTYKKETSSGTSSGGNKKPVSKTPEKKRENNKEKPRTCTVGDAGCDCLWNIAIKFYGDQKKESAIYAANKEVIEKTARKYGKSSSNNGWWIYDGTVLVLP